MTRYFITDSRGLYFRKGVSTVKPTLELFAGEPSMHVVTQPVCKLKNGDNAIAVSQKILPQNCTRLAANNRDQLSHDAFYAMHCFFIISRLMFLRANIKSDKGKTALDQITGLIEPVFQGRV